MPENSTPIEKSIGKAPLTILGLSKSGCSVARYAARAGHSVFLSEMLPGNDNNLDQRQALEALGVDIEMGGHSQHCFNHSDEVVVSPGIPPTSAMIEQLVLSQKRVMSEVEYAFRESRHLSKPPVWIGVTGTNGKTTTVSGIEKILLAAGKNVVACGNIGLPVTDCLSTHAQADHWVVELSSFQLHFSPTLVPQVAVFLNLTPDHINWHGSFEAYKAAKLSLFLPKNSGEAPEWLILNADDPVSQDIDKQVSTRSRCIWFSQENRIPERANDAVFSDAEGRLSIRWDGCLRDEISVNLSEAALKGKHNGSNILAMIAATLACGVPLEAIVNTVLSFTGVEHRLEPVLLSSQTPTMQVINDSKATNVNSTLAAIEAFQDRPLVLLLGGRLKNEPLAPLIEAIQDHVETVVVYGEAGPAISQALLSAGYSKPYQTAELLADATNIAWQATQHLVKTAGSSAEPVLLFSPAAASFDQFKDFEARGAAFKQAIQACSHSATHSEVMG